MRSLPEFPSDDQPGSGKWVPSAGRDFSQVAPFRHRRIECAGRAFQSRHENINGLNHSPTGSSDNSDEETARYAAQYAHLRTLHASEHEDLYLLLGLEHLRWRATESEIRQAYKRATLHCHPDRTANLSEKGREISIALFKRLQRAISILLDRRRRIAYDSVDDVDDTIPSAISVETDDDFYRTFQPVIARNARWSRRQPAPLLGNATSSDDQVRAFYQFWFSFESWREFTLEAMEQEAAQASHREERRRIESMYRKEATRRKTEENARIRKLIETVYALDPRIQRMLRDERERKEQERAERKRERIAQQEAQREREHQARLERQKRETEARRLSDVMVQTMHVSQSSSSHAKPLKNDKVEWTEADQARLVQALKKHPPGTRNRWIQVAASMHHTHTPEIIQQQFRRMQSAPVRAPTNDAPPNAAMWTKQEQSRLEEALVRHAARSPDDPERWRRISVQVATRSAAECRARFEELSRFYQRRARPGGV